MSIFQNNHILSVFLRSLEKYSNNKALWVGDEYYSYKDIYVNAIKLSRFISFLYSKNGVDYIQRCAILSDRSFVGFYSIVASGLSNCSYVPLNSQFPVSRNAVMLKTSQAKLVVADSKCLDQLHLLLAEIDTRLFVLLPDLEVLPDWAVENKQHCFFIKKDCLGGDYRKNSLAFSEEAYLLFTSGSTGKPKAISVSHKNALSYLKNIAELFPLNAKDRCTQLFDLTFDLSVHDMFACWQAGACLYVPSQEQILFARQFIQQHEITVWFSVPSLAVLLNDYGVLTENSLPSLRITLFCGEALPASVAQVWNKAAANSILANLYGPTEATIAITYHLYQPSLVDKYSSVIPIGDVFPDHELQIVDQFFKPVARGEEGELLLGGPQITPGYVGNKSATEKQFVRRAFPDKKSCRWYRTGDLVSLKGDLGLSYHGRIDQQLKVRGYRVEVAEIEACLRKISCCNQVAVVPFLKDDAGNVQVLGAYVVAEVIDTEQVLHLVNQSLPDYMNLSCIQLLAKMPLNGNGKTDYKYLTDVSRQSYQASKDTLEV